MKDKKLNKALDILNIINKNGSEARFVGGAVRDYLLGLEVKEVDIAVNLEPKEIIEIFKKEVLKTIPTGIDFGTITVLYEDEKYEITSLRSDLQCDGRHAKVSYSKSFEEDSKRRDFTMNALYMDANGKIYDFHNGKEDLEQRIVKFIGKAEERIKEDYLRILRYFRFLSYFGTKNIAESDLIACIDLREGLKQISGERIRQELFKTLNTKHSEEILKLLFKNGFFPILFDAKESDFHLNYYCQNNISFDSELMILASLIKAESFEKSIEVIGNKLKFTKLEKQNLKLVFKGLKIDFNNRYQVNNFIRKNGKVVFLNAIKIIYLNKMLSLDKLEELEIYCNNFNAPKFPIKAEDFIKIGLKPGKELGQKLKQAEEIWEKSEYKLGKEEVLGKLMS